MNIIFQINGGIGKAIAATAVIKAIKKKYKKDNLIVVSGYPDVFLNNPHVHKHFSFGNTPYFFQDFMKDSEYLTMLHDPYMDTDFLYQQHHLIEVWCKMNNLSYDGEMPELYLTQREKDFFANMLTSDKPIFVLQTNGGAPDQVLKYSWARDLPAPVVTKVIEHFKDKYNIVHIRREDQPGYNFTTPFQDIFRKIVVLLAVSEKRLLIDSFAQHACAALNIPAVVCWIANKPEVFGYKIHKNIVANKFTKNLELRNSYLNEFNIAGDPLQFPYNDESEIFDAESIITALD